MLSKIHLNITKDNFKQAYGLGNAKSSGSWEQELCVDKDQILVYISHKLKYCEFEDRENKFFPLCGKNGQIPQERAKKVISLQHREVEAQNEKQTPETSSPSDINAIEW